jgi:hypothetical protein
MLSMLALPVVSSKNVAYTPGTNLTGIENLSNCYRQNHKLVVDFMIDETASLRFGNDGTNISTPGTDPNANRVKLVNDVVRALGSLTSFSPGEVMVRADAFGTGLDYSDPYSSFRGNSPSGPQNPPVNWTSVNPTTVGPISSRVAQYFTSAYGDQNTDYFQSLSASYQNVIKEANALSPVPGSVCSAIIMFTDGQMSFINGYQPPWSAVRVSPSTLSSVENKGFENLCSPSGGLIEELRQQNVYFFAAGLSSPTAPGQSFQLLKQLAGVAPGCGSPNGTGQFFNGSVDNMVSGLLSGLVGGEALAAATCTPSACSQSFVVHRYTKSALIYVAVGLPAGQSGSPGQLELVSPQGKILPIPNQGLVSDLGGGVTLHSYVSSSWEGSSPRIQRIIALNFSSEVPANRSQWTLTLVPQAGYSPTLTTRVDLISGVGLHAASSGTWRRGSTGLVSYSLAYRGSTIPASEVSRQSLSAAVSFGGGLPALTVPVNQLGRTNAFTVEVHIPTNTISGVATVRLRGAVTLRTGDVIPANAVPITSITVLPPHGPTVAPTLDFHVINAVRVHHRNAAGVEPVLPVSVEGHLTVSAGSNGAGQFCFTGASGIYDGGQVAAIHPVGKRCYLIASNEKVHVPFLLSIRSPVTGILHGTIRGFTKSSGVSYAATTSLTGNVLVPLPDPITNQKTLWSLIVVSIAIPLGLWIGLSWWNARFKDPTKVRGYKVEVEVTGVDTTSESPSLTWHDWDFLPPGKPRTLLFRDLEIHAPVRILRTQDAIVSRPGYLAIGSLGSQRGSSKGRIAHKIQGQWVFVTPLSGVDGSILEASSISGELYFFVIDGAESAELGPDGLIERAFTGLHLQFEEIRGRIASVVKNSAPGTPAQNQPVESPL